MAVMAIVEARAPLQCTKLPARGVGIATWSLRGASTPERARPRLLDRDEVCAVLQGLDGVPRLMARLLYGAGLRVLECCQLRIPDIDFTTNQVVVRGGKGDKDRVTMLPATTKTGLARHLEAVQAQHPQP